MSFCSPVMEKCWKLKWIIWLRNLVKILYFLPLCSMKMTQWNEGQRSCIEPSRTVRGVLFIFFLLRADRKLVDFFAGIFDPEQSRSNLVFFFLFAPGYLPCKNHFLVYWFQRMINCNIPDSSKNPNEICRLSVLMRIRAKSCEDTRMWDINFYDYSDGEKFIKGIA